MSNIQWTDVTDNIIVAAGGDGKPSGWWCRKISDGCKNCYAAKLNQSAFFGGNKMAYSGEPPKLLLRTEIINGWQRQRSPKKHFVASMTDVFGEWVERSWIWLYLDGMVRAPLQTFQVLTKRSDVMLREVVAWLDAARGLVVPQHIWLGVSVENRATLHRVAELRRVPAVTRFLSLEPLLENIGPIDLTGISWVIVGGESGPGARPCDVEWIRTVVAQCASAGVPVFVKQLGAKPIEGQRLTACGSMASDPLFCVICGVRVRTDDEWLVHVSGLRLSHPKGGDMSEWPTDLRIREFPAARSVETHAKCNMARPRVRTVWPAGYVHPDQFEVLKRKAENAEKRRMQYDDDALPGYTEAYPPWMTEALDRVEGKSDDEPLTNAETEALMRYLDGDECAEES